jgi:hypothetical protein
MIRVCHLETSSSGRNIWRVGELGLEYKLESFPCEPSANNERLWVNGFKKSN